MALPCTQGQPSADLHREPGQGRACRRDLVTGGVGGRRERPAGVDLLVLRRPAGVCTQGAQRAFKATAVASACTAALFLDAIPPFVWALFCSHSACAQHPPCSRLWLPALRHLAPSVHPHPACPRSGPGTPQARHPGQDEGGPLADAEAQPSLSPTPHSGAPPRAQLLLTTPPRRGAVAWDERHDGGGYVWRRRATFKPQ